MNEWLQKLVGIDYIPRRSKKRRIGTFKLRGQPTLHELITRESEIGGSLFGPIPGGHYRQFFNLDRHTWVWHEEWDNEDGETIETTITYTIKNNGILKVQEGKNDYYIEGHELLNLVAAIRKYYEAVSREIYHRDPATGKLIIPKAQLV